MEVKFGRYRFSKDQGLLYCGDELIVLKRNQANLLTLFLEEPDRVFSKDEILERVWRGRVVSEQVVFQTISQLRAILGDAAITTYAKKGYKWQLKAIEMLESETPTSQFNTTASRYFTPLKSIAIMSFIAISIVAFYLYADHNTAVPPSPTAQLHVMVTDKANSEATNILNNNDLAKIENTPFAEQIAFIESARHVSELFSSPKATWRNANLSASDWLLLGETFRDQNGTYLHYLLVKDKLVWSGYIHSATKEDLSTKLKQKLADLSKMGLFDLEATHLALAEILRLQKQAPHAPELQLLLADEYVYMGQFDTALVQLKQLTNKPDDLANIPYQAEAYWLIGKIYKMREQHEMANLALDKMAKTLDGSPLWNLNFQNVKTSALLAFEEFNYQRMYEVLTRGETLAKQQADPYTQFDLHILFAMLAGKTQHMELKGKHLKFAQEVLNQHKLNDANLISFYYLLAEQTDTSLTALPFLEKILNLPRTSSNYWLQDDALQQIVQHHITTGDFDRAHNLTNAPDDSVLKLRLKADIWLAQNKPELALPLLIESFDQARLQYNKLAGLKAAKTLLSIDSAHLTDKQEYIAFVEHYSDPKGAME